MSLVQLKSHFFIVDGSNQDQPVKVFTSYSLNNENIQVYIWHYVDKALKS
jgi:hypothetical protein